MLAAIALPGATSTWLTPSTHPGHAQAPAASAGARDIPYAAISRVDLVQDQLLHPSPAVGPRAYASGMFERTQVVSLYGYPGVPGMGDLGKYSPDEAAVAAARIAANYDALSGDRGAIGALHLVVSVAHPEQTTEGSYLTRLDSEVIATYVEAARRHGVLLILDTKCGTADPVEEARRLQPYLVEPFVHLALDPEFAMRAGGIPGRDIGRLDSSEVNAVQRYLAGLVREHALPQKMLVVHQFRADMLTHSERWQETPEVRRVVTVDAWGPLDKKLQAYDAFATAVYAESAGIMLFEGWDEPMLTPAQVLALPRPPDLVVYH